MDEVRSLLASATIRLDPSAYGHLLRAECEAILGEAAQDLERREPDLAGTVADLELASDALHEHIESLRPPELPN
jgi:hypothetical protein